MVFNNTVLWLYIQHSDVIKDNSKNRHGDRLGHKLSFLEGIGALAGPCSMAKLMKNKSLVIHVHNSGTVFSFNKAYSRDPYTYTALLATEVVCRSLNINVRLVKTPGCSGRLEIVTDLLSKGRIGEALTTMGSPNRMLEVPKTLLKYMRMPSKFRLL